MSQVHEYLFMKFGMLIYILPAALILLIGREWYLFSVMSKLGVFSETHYTEKTKNPFLTFDLWSFITLIFGGYAWGGLINREKNDTIVSFIFAQLWFVLCIIIAFIFLQAKDLEKTSYMHMFLLEIIKKSWVLHLFNYLPIPPFDGSFFYMQKRNMHSVTIVSKIAMTVFILFFPLKNDFLSGQSFLKLIGLN